MNETVKLALGTLGLNKLRTFLTMSGIAIGVFSVIGVMTTVSALRGSIESGLSFLGADVFQFAKWPSGIQSIGQDRHKFERRRNIRLAEAQRYIRRMAGTADVISLKVFAHNGDSQATYGGRKTPDGLEFGGTNEYFCITDQFNIGLGRNFTAADVDFKRPVAIIGQDVADKLFPSESPLGKRIKAAGHAYTVIGVYGSKGSMFGRSEDSIVMVPITRFLDDFGPEGYTIGIATQAPSQEVYDATMEEGIAAMRLARGLLPGQENDFELYANDSLIAAFAKIADAVRAGAFVISGIALLAAGVGIMNIMLVSVTERTKEIGIRKAVGARRSTILAQFLVESVAISVAGGLVGIVMGVAAGNILALRLSASIVFPWNWAATGLLVCSAIGVGFGLYPAWMAASLDPVEALRHE